MTPIPMQGQPVLARLSPRQLNRAQRVSTALQFLQYCQVIESGTPVCADGSWSRGRELDKNEAACKRECLQLLGRFVSGEIGNPDCEAGDEAAEPGSDEGGG